MRNSKKPMSKLEKYPRNLFNGHSGKFKILNQEFISQNRVKISVTIYQITLTANTVSSSHMWKDISLPVGL